MSFSRKILVGASLGIAVGVILGELVSPLAIVADGFVRLLQVSVLPYVTVSIILSLGSLDLTEAKRLGLKAGIGSRASGPLLRAYLPKYPNGIEPAFPLFSKQ